jgi:hypothetical protein
LWGASKVRLDGRTIELTIPARDAVVLELT